MYIIRIDGLPVKTKIEVTCDECGVVVIRTIAATKEQRKNRGVEKDYCRSCASKICCDKKPQCNSNFWVSEERKNKHSKSMKNSISYYEAIKNRPSIAGKNNPNWGRKASAATRKKMSISRTGKTGEKATAWKGGKLSLTKRVKSALQRKYSWFHRVMDRDECTCQYCGKQKRLDANHIEPIANIIKELLADKNLTESEKMDWLIVQPEIVDNELINGITLCRKCHREIHKNWGSHEPQVK